MAHANDLDLDKAMHTARLAVEAAGRAALRFFPGLGPDGKPAAQTALGLEWKSDGSPVTLADTAAEAAILEVIRAAFPSHAILTEESGEHAALIDQASKSAGAHAFPRSLWIVDPLDGTARFARGLRTWGPIVALQHEGEIVAGASALPAMSEVYWAARDRGFWRNGERRRASDTREWSRASLGMGVASRLLASHRAAGVRRLMETAAYVAAGGDIATGLWTLSGQLDAFIEFGVKVWDVATYKVMAQEAGASWCDFDGADSVEGGSTVLCAPGVREHVMRELGIAR